MFFQYSDFIVRSFKPCGTKQSVCLTCIYLTTQWQQHTFAVQSGPQVLMSEISSGQEPKGKDKKESSKQRRICCFPARLHHLSEQSDVEVPTSLCQLLLLLLQKKSFIINTLWKEVKCSLFRLVHVPAKGKRKRSAGMRCQVCFCLHKEGEIMSRQRNASQQKRVLLQALPWTSSVTFNKLTDAKFSPTCYAEKPQDSKDFKQVFKPRKEFQLKMTLMHKVV